MLDGRVLSARSSRPPVVIRNLGPNGGDVAAHLAHERLAGICRPGIAAKWRCTRCRRTTLGTVSRSAEIFNPATERWTMTGEMVQSHNIKGVLVPLLDGRIFLADSDRDSEIYKPQTGTWRTSAIMPTVRADYPTTRLSDGRIMVTGGNATLRSVESFNPVTETWTTAASLLTGRVQHRAVLLPDGRVLVAGGREGRGDDSPFLNSTEIYNPIADTWSAGPSMGRAQTSYSHP